MVSKDAQNHGGSQAPLEIIRQSPVIREKIIRFFGKIGHRTVNGGVQEQLDISQHHHVVQSPGWCQ
jgi:hypothetical protein